MKKLLHIFLFVLLLTGCGGGDGDTGESSEPIEDTDNNTPISNLAPTANAGADTSVLSGGTVILNGANSDDSDGSISSYTWIQIGGENVALSNNGTDTASFTAPIVGVNTILTFRLIVTDNIGDADTDDVIITILPPPEVVSTTPTDLATNTSLSTSIEATFNIDMFATSIDNTSFTVSNSMGAIPSVVNYDMLSKVASFTPSNPLSLATNYIANLDSSITSLDGASILPTSWSFTTRYGQWGTAIPFEVDNSTREILPEIDMSDNGDTIVVWAKMSLDDYSIDVFAKHYTLGQGWDAPVLIDTNSAYVRVAMDDNGNAIALWQRDEVQGNLWAKHYTAGVGWGSGVRLVADLPQAPYIGAYSVRFAMNASGKAIAVYLKRDPNALYVDTIWASHYFPILGFWVEELIDNNERNFENLQIAMDDDGNATVVLMSKDEGKFGKDIWNIWSKRYTPGGGWGAAELVETDEVNDAKDPQVAMDGNGNAIAVWSQGTEFNAFNIALTRRYIAGVGWSDTEYSFLSNNSGEVFYPQISMDPDGNATAVWHQEDGIRRSIWAKRYTEGAGWGTEVLLETTSNESLYPRIAMDDKGNATAVWMEVGDVINSIWSNRYTVGEGWNGAERIENNTYSSFPYAEVMMDASGRATAVWPQDDQGDGPANIWTNSFE